MIVLRGTLDTEKGIHGLGKVHSPYVLYENGSYKMYYAGEGKDGYTKIHLATSKDGIKFVKNGVVLGKANSPSIVRMPSQGHYRYNMYYNDSLGVGLATSSNGIGWTRRGIVVNDAKNPNVLLTDKFHMFYDLYGCIGYTTSIDGKKWSGHRIVMTDKGELRVNEAGVTQIGKQFVMLYGAAGGVWMLESDNGILWKDHKIVLLSEDCSRPTLIGDYIYCGVAITASWNQVVIARFEAPDCIKEKYIIKDIT